MARTYVLDTNVLLFDPKSLFYFEEHKVVIPLLVIEETDRFKKNQDETGRNARTVSRYIDKLRERGSLKAGVDLKGGGTLRVAFLEDLPQKMSYEYADNAILALAKDLADKAGTGDEVILVSRDTNMRIKADAIGLIAQDYRHDKVLGSTDQQYSGQIEILTSSQDLDDFFETGHLPVLSGFPTVYPHQMVVLTNGYQKSALCKVDAAGKYLERYGMKSEAWGILGRNKEQAFALNVLMDPRIQLVTLSGQAGTGKTLLAIAAGLQQVCNDLKGSGYKKMLVARPVIPMGKDIGYLPGDINEKLNPWMQPIYDNLELIFEGAERSRTNEPAYRHLFERGLIQVEALTYIRGRSIPDHLMIIDEAQNLSPHEVKTILTRAGEGSKIILTGDPNQIDNPYVDSASNGLTYVVERFKNSGLAAHISFTKGERSQLAQVASELL